MLLHLVLKRAEGFSSGPDGDASLLQRFAANRDESAFASLLQRHGPMVWSVCRHLLADEADAEDAFQATFLALVRSAKRVRKAEAVGAWLHGVAVRIAAKAKRTAARRRLREERVAGPEADRPIPEAAWNDLLAAVHEEVQNLPEHLRTAFVLCELEGVRQPDAAARLGWKAGTLTGRLTRARQMLVRRLAGRGLSPALGGGGLAIGLATASDAIPVQLIASALSLIRAGGPVPPAILNLMKEAAPMVAIRSKLAAAVVLFAGGLCTVLFPVANAQFPGAGAGQPPPVGGPPGVGTPAYPGIGGGPPPGPGSGTSGPPRGDSAFGSPPSAKTQWEYKFEGADKDFTKQFANLGNDGWEYCAPLALGGQEVLVFKRQKATPPRGIGGGGSGYSGFGAMPGMAPSGGGSLPALPPGGGGPPPGTTPMGVPNAGAGEAPAAASSLVVLQLRNAAAADLAIVLDKLFPKNLTVAVEMQSNSLILRGNSQTIDEVKALIAKLDTASPKPPTVRP